jgi:hypothetical protein
MDFETGHILKPPYKQCALAVERYNALLDAESPYSAKNRRSKAIAA